MTSIDLGRGSTEPDESVGGALLACHAKIRSFMRTAARLASDEPAAPADVASSAAALARYFTEALPRHARDEDESLAPRLRAAGFDGDLDALQREHDEIDAYLERLVPAWRDIAADPARRTAHALAADTSGLADLFERHLSWEEEHLIPRLAGLLTTAQLEEIRREMKARRD